MNDQPKISNRPGLRTGPRVRTLPWDDSVPIDVRSRDEQRFVDRIDSLLMCLAEAGWPAEKRLLPRRDENGDPCFGASIDWATTEPPLDVVHRAFQLTGLGDLLP